MNEVWVELKRSKDYLVSNTGFIYTKERRSKNGTLINGRILRCSIGNHGYKAVSLTINNKKRLYLLHRLIAESFVENPNNYEYVNHIDGNKLNNHHENLEWCTKGMNCTHAFKTGLMDSILKKVLCVNTGIEYDSASECARELGLSQGNVSSVCRGERTHTHNLKFQYINSEVV